MLQMVSLELMASLKNLTTVVLYVGAVSHWLVNSKFWDETDRAIQKAQTWATLKLKHLRDPLERSFAHYWGDPTAQLLGSEAWQRTLQARKVISQLLELALKHPWHHVGVVVLVVATGVDVLFLKIVYGVFMVCIWSTKVLFFPVWIVFWILKLMALHFISRFWGLMGRMISPSGAVLAATISVALVQRKQTKEANSSNANDNSDDISTLSTNGMCCLCLTAPSTHAFLPCGHRCCCSNDALRILHQVARCPVCNRRANSAVRIYDT
jgi:hypothetical protein